VSVVLQVLEADDRRYALDRTLSESQTEIASLRSLNENLMRKLKKLSSNAHDSGAKDFAETFEEVMREEMMAMKTAFEAKLRVAVEERDTATRRHQTELMRLQSRVHALGTT
jgi:gamma-glutamyl:cysteine ligase YbdK (ATP-grasp superfamily)